VHTSRDRGWNLSWGTGKRRKETTKGHQKASLHEGGVGLRGKSIKKEKARSLRVISKGKRPENVYLRASARRAYVEGGEGKSCRETDDVPASCELVVDRKRCWPAEEREKKEGEGKRIEVMAGKR